MSEETATIEEKENKAAVKICRYCRSEIDRKAKVCPVCRKKQSRTGKVVAIVLLVLALLFAGLCALVVDAAKQSLAENIGEAMTDGELFTDYDVKKGDGGYYITVYANPTYAEDGYMQYHLTGISDQDKTDAANLYKWSYYIGDQKYTYEAFVLEVTAGVYLDTYNQVLDTYSDILDSYSQMFQ